VGQRHGGRPGANLKFKFADPVAKKKDYTNESLEALLKLDGYSRVSGAKILEDHMSKKRHKQSKKEEKAKEEEESTVFTEEDFARLERDLFLHSKPTLKSVD